MAAFVRRATTSAGAIGIGRGFGAFGSLGIDDTLAKSHLPDGKKRDRAGVAHSVSERFQRYRHRLQPRRVIAMPRAITMNLVN